MSLRMVEIYLPQDYEGQGINILKELDTLGTWEQPLPGEMTLLRVLIESDRAESVIDLIEKRFSYRPGFRVILLPVEATLPRPDEKKKPPKPAPEVASRRGIVVEELVQDLSGGAKMSATFFITVILSSIVAAIGLMKDNVAVVIGAMVIAPLLSPNIALALATTIGDLKLALHAIRTSIAGMAVALLFAFVLGMVMHTDTLSHEISSRTFVSLSDVVLALVSGIAGAMAFTTGLSANLVGVMVAVALLPPLVVAGVLAGAGQYELAMRAGLLLTTNIICVNLASVGTFFFKGVQPRSWWKAKRTRRIVYVVLSAWILLLTVAVFLILQYGPTSL